MTALALAVMSAGPAAADVADVVDEAAVADAADDPERAEEPVAWRGPWRVEGSSSWRHVGARGDLLLLDGRLAGLDVSARGRAGRDGFELAGTAFGADGVERRVRLVARAAVRRGRQGPVGALHVRLHLEGQASPLEERWVRAEAPAIRLVPPSGRRDPADPAPEVVFAPGDPAGGGLRLELQVVGRPQAVTLTVLAPDDPRYEHLGGVVHHAELAAAPEHTRGVPAGRARGTPSRSSRGETSSREAGASPRRAHPADPTGARAPLAVGRHVVTWSGADRSVAGAAVLPGRYLVVVTPAEGLLGPPPGEAAGQATATTLTLVVPGPAAPVAAARHPASPDAALEAPRPGLATGVAAAR